MAESSFQENTNFIFNRCPLAVTGSRALIHSTVQRHTLLIFTPSVLMVYV